jgi:hypothetical protein
MRRCSVRSTSPGVLTRRQCSSFLCSGYVVGNTPLGTDRLYSPKCLEVEFSEVGVWLSARSRRRQYFDAVLASHRGEPLSRRPLCLFCRRFTSTGGRARTDTVLSHHRILSPATRVPLCPSVSGNVACLRGFSALHARRYTVVFNSVLVRLQYGCSTLLLQKGCFITLEDEFCEVRAGLGRVASWRGVKG